MGTGQLQSISRDDGTTVRSLQFTYDGPLPASTTWAHASEVANGSVSYGYDAHFRLDQVRVNGQVMADMDWEPESGRRRHQHQHQHQWFCRWLSPYEIGNAGIRLLDLASGEAPGTTRASLESLGYSLYDYLHSDDACR